MRTKEFLAHALCGACLLMTQRAGAQASTLGHLGGTGDYCGWNGTTSMPLEVRHNGNYPIEWYTDSIGRMRLSPSVTGPMGPGDPFPSVNRDGYLLLTGVPAALTDPNCRAPFTRLHLVDQEIPTTPNNYAQQQGFRPWQRNGITLTGNNDQSYIGQKYNGTDVTDLVVQWSDNPDSSPYGTDRMKFVFTTLYNSGSTRGAATMDGLEAMRLYPATYEEVHVGIGDYSQPGMGDPTERLELLDRTIRLRRIIPDYNNDTLTRVVMVDSNGRLHWRRLSTWPSSGGGGGSDCDWNIANATTSGSGVAHTLWTATGTNDLCPDGSDEVGVGTSAPLAKLHVFRDVTVDGAPREGVRAHIKGDDGGWNTGVVGKSEPASGTVPYVAGVVGEAYNASSHLIGTRGRAFMNTAISGSEVDGVRGEAQVTSPDASVSLAVGVYGDATCSAGTVTNNYGSYARGYGGSNAYGAYGLANGTASTAVAVGVRGKALGASQFNIGLDAQADYAASASTKYGVRSSATQSGKNYGVITSASGGSENYGVHATVIDTTGSNWAGYFKGKVQVTGNMWHNATFIFSDANLKNDVNPVEGGTAGELLAQLAPRSYHYQVDAYPQMNLPGSLQYGFLAQEVREVLPNLVSNTIVPAEVDSLGNVLHEQIEVSGINYVGMIPLLVASVKEQNTRIAELEQALSACCASGLMLQGSGSAQEQVTGTGEEALIGLGRLLRIAPNPFTDRTTLYYNLERAGRAQLLVNSADGRDLRVLSEAQRVAGEYQFEWDTTGLAPGMYYVTLLLDGEPVVKRAVKVQR